MEAVRSIYGNLDATVRTGILVADNQTINVGDLLQLNSTGISKVEVAIAASTTIIGYALNAITTTTATTSSTVDIQMARGTVFRAPYSTTGSKTTFASSDLYNVAYDLLNKTTINTNDTSGGMCYIQGFNNTAVTVDFIINSTNLAFVG